MQFLLLFKHDFPFQLFHPFLLQRQLLPHQCLNCFYLLNQLSTLRPTEFLSIQHPLLGRLKLCHQQRRLLPFGLQRELFPFGLAEDLKGIFVGLGVGRGLAGEEGLFGGPALLQLTGDLLL